jgi:hypothetical protein
LISGIASAMPKAAFPLPFVDASENTGCEGLASANPSREAAQELSHRRKP